MTSEAVEAPVSATDGRPVCKHCGGEMTLMMRQEVTDVLKGAIVEGVFMVSYQESVSSSDDHYWWSCRSHECWVALVKADQDAPYELELGEDLRIDWY